MKDLLNYVVKGRLSKREIRTLHKDLDIYRNQRIDAQVGSGDRGRKDLSVRNSTIFFPKHTNFPKTFNILQSTIIGAYHGICSYIDLTNFAEIQYARYDEGCFFKKHRDTIYQDNTFKRTLTFSINVSEEQNYDGGELIVFDEKGNEIEKLSKEIGSYIIFPSVYFHEATTVTRGTREAIVTWIHSNDETHNRFKNEIYNLGNNINVE